MKKPTKIETYLIQNKENQDEMLHQKLFNVNLRLLKNNKEYRQQIENIISYMTKILQMDFSNYTKPKGISGANVGIPFNIIIVIKKDKPLVMINPVYIPTSTQVRDVMSNCGSLNLSKPITVNRCCHISVTYYTLDGYKTIKTFTGQVANTIQHEIDHNQGILIIDKQTEGE